MKKNTRLLYLLFSSLAMGVYMGLVNPDITNPLTLTGFFIILIALLFWLYSVLLGFISSASALYSTSFVLSLGSVYLLALSTLNSLGLVDVAVVLCVIALLIGFVIKPRKN